MDFSFLSFTIGTIFGIICTFIFTFYVGYKLTKKRKGKRAITKYEVLVSLREAERDLLKRKELFLKDIEFELGKIEEQRKIIAETSGTTIASEQLPSN